MLSGHRRRFRPPKGGRGRAEELRATPLAGGATWITLAGPAGHPFCLSLP